MFNKKRVFLYSHNPASEGAKALARAMGIRRIRHHNSKYRARPGDVLINWGSSTWPRGLYGKGMINTPPCVSAASHKLQTFKFLQKDGIPIPEWTTDKDVVRKSIYGGEGAIKWFARHVLNGSGGKGIQVLDNFLDIPDAPLYVKYIPKKKEFRAHVIGNEVVDIQQKVRRKDLPKQENAYLIRNVANGFVFARNDIDVPEDLRDLALRSVKALGLDFGAVDLIWNEKQNKCYVLEVNTAPGLQGTTIEVYRNHLWKLVQNAV